MPRIAGSSQYLNASVLANKQGVGAQAPTLLGEAGTTSLLDAGRGVAGSGLGLSSSARAINQQFLNNTSEINALLSLALGPGATISGLQGQILALRASLPDSAIDSSVSGIVDDGSVSSSDLGTTLDDSV